MFPPKDLAIFALVWLKVVVQPPFQQFQRQACSAYCSFKTDTQEDGSSEQEARSSVVNVMQGVTQQLGQPEKSEQSEQVITIK